MLIQRFDGVDLPTDNEFDERFDVRLSDEVAILSNNDESNRRFARFGNPVDGCGQQCREIAKLDKTPLPPPRASNQIGYPRHALPFAEREQVVGESFVLAGPRYRGVLPALARLALRRQLPCLAQLRANPVFVPRLGT